MVLRVSTADGGRRAATGPRMTPDKTAGKISTRYVTRNPRIAYDHCGVGTAVVFLHAIGGNRTNWREQLPIFGQSYQAIAMDMRGYGESDDYDGAFRVEDVCADIDALLDDCGCPDAHIVGLSIGGRLALDYYERRSARVRSLVLCATFHKSGFMNPQDWAEFRAKRSDRLLAGAEPKDIAEEVARTLVWKNAAAVVRARVIASMAALHKLSYVKAIDGIHAYHKTAQLEAIDVPTLVVAGEFDRPSTPEYCREMWKEIRDAQFCLVPSSGHMLNMEQPDYFNRHVLDFLRAADAGTILRSKPEERRSVS